MRLIFLTLGVVVGYAWVSHLRRRDVAVRRSLTESGIMAFALFVLGAVAAFNDLFYRWAITISQFLDTWPLDATVVGLAIGYIAADQNSGSARAVSGAGTSAPPSPQHAGAYEGAGPVGTVLYALRAAAPGFALLAMVVAALVPTETWREAGARLQGLKAGGIEISLGSATGANLAQEIRSAEVQRDTLGNTNERDRNGFTRPRLGRMLALTQAPMVEVGPEQPDGAAAPNDAPDLVRNPTGFIFAHLPPKDDWVRAAPMVHHIQRDRAIVLHLAAGERAQDSRSLIPSAAASQPRTAPPPALPPLLISFGTTQERLLRHMAQHVRCVEDLVDVTRNRLVLEYRSMQVVDHLAVFTRMWSDLEHELALAYLEPPGRQTSREDAIEALRRRAEGLDEALERFSSGAHDTVANLQRLQSDPSRPPSNPLLNRCLKGSRGTFKGLVEQVLSDRQALQASGFAPYLTLFAAQVLSGLGDHASAVQMLVGWLNQLRDLQGRTASHTLVAARPNATTVARAQDSNWMLRTISTGVAAAVPPPAQGSSQRAQYSMLLMKWLELAVFVEIATLQQQSEGTEFGVPATEAGLRHIVSVLFPAVFERIQQPLGLDEWRKPTLDACRKPSMSWRQSLVLSYATWVRAYLDVRNKNLLRPADIGPEDLDFAARLVTLNLDCFSSTFEAGARGKQERDEERARFAITAAAIRLNALVDSQSLPRAERDRLRKETDDILRGALFALEKPAFGTQYAAGGQHGGQLGRTEYDRLVFGQADDSLVRNLRQLKERLDKLQRY